MTEAIPDNANPTAEGGSSKRSVWIGGVLIVLAAILLYWHTQRYELVFDDKHIISQNSSITCLKDDPSGFIRLFSQEFWQGSHTKDLPFLQPKGQALYRPVMLALLGAIYVSTDNAPSAYHLVNVLLYALVCLAAFLAVRKLFRSDLLAFFTGLLFAVHPIHTESVAYVTGMGELLGALFFFLALLLYFKAGYEQERFRPLPYLLSLLCFLVGLFSKEHVVTFLGVIVLYDVLQALGGRRPLGLAARIGLYAGYLVVLAANLAARYHAIGGLEPGPQNPLDNPIAAALSFDVRLWTALKVVAKGLWMTVWPVHQSPDYSFAAIPLSLGLLEAEVLAAVLFLGTLVVLAAANLRRRPVVSFAVLWHLGTIFLVSNIVITVGTIFGERLLFLPSFGFCLVAGWILDRIALLGRRPDRRLGAGTAVAMLLLAVATGAYAAKTVRETRKWENEERLWEAAKKACPDSAKVHFQLGQIYVANKLYPEAEEEYRRALAIEPPMTLAQLSLAKLYVLERQFDKAIQVFEALKQGGGMIEKNEDLRKEVEGNLAQLYMLTKKTDQAVKSLEQMKAEKNTPLVNIQLGDQYMQASEYEKAAACYVEAWKLQPDKFDAAYKLLQTYTAMKKYDEEKKLLDRLEKEDPDPYPAYLYRARALVRDLEKEQALSVLDKAIAAAPERPQAYLLKAEILQSAYRLEEAIPLLEKAAAVSPKKRQADPLLREMAIFMKLRRFKEADAVAAKLERLPQSPAVKNVLGELRLEEHRYEEAAQLLREAVAGGVKAPATYVGLGEALASLNRYEDVVAYLTPAVEEMQIQHPDLYRILGTALVATGQYEKGVDLLKKTLRIFGPNPWVKFQVGQGELGLKHYDKAREIFEILEKNDAVKPLRPFIHHLQARILIEDEAHRDPAAAAAKAKQALAEHPAGGDPSFYLTLAKALAASGDPASAKKVAEEGIAKFPGDKKLEAFVKGL